MKYRHLVLSTVAGTKVRRIARIIRFYFTFVFGSSSACALHHIHAMAGRLQLQFDPTSC
jgi:hypothetical protein